MALIILALCVGYLFNRTWEPIINISFQMPSVGCKPGYDQVWLAPPGYDLNPTYVG